MSATILIVEDETDLASTVEYNLQREGYRTRIATSGARALDELERDPPPDLVLLDLMLPDMSGTEVCRRIRANERTKLVPVIMCTARNDEIDRVVGFEVGADDYVAKPFSVRELALRIRAHLRRARPPETVPTAASFGVLDLDAERHRVWVNREEVLLTALEFKLLATLMHRRGRVQSRTQLLRDVWEMEHVASRTVDTHVKRLRQKLGAASSYIETLRGVGYRFRESPSVPVCP